MWARNIILIFLFILYTQSEDFLSSLFLTHFIFFLSFLLSSLLYLFLSFLWLSSFHFFRVTRQLIQRIFCDPAFGIQVSIILFHRNWYVPSFLVDMICYDLSRTTLHLLILQVIHWLLFHSLYPFVYLGLNLVLHRLNYTINFTFCSCIFLSI